MGEIYIKLVVSFPNDPKVRALARYGNDAGLARDLYVQMCLYCKDLLTDGFVPAEQLGLLVYPLDPEHGNQLAKQLASVGLIKEVSNGEAQGWQVSAYLKRNGTKEDVERLSQVRAEAGRVGGVRSRKPPGQRAAQANRKQVAKQKVSQADPYTETESETESEKEEAPAADTLREDVERLCLHLADRIEGNGCKRPTVTVKWRDAARLMIDNDGRPEDKIHTAIDYAQDSEFWRINVASMPKLREQYDKLRLSAQRDQRQQAGGPTTDDRVQQALDSGRRVQAFIDQNGGTS